MDPSLTPQEQALSVLRAINKSVTSAIQYDLVPLELCIGEHINLDRWSMVLTDSNLIAMSKQPEEAYIVDASKPTVQDMFWKFHEPKLLSNGIISLSLKEAKDINDHSLSLVIRQSPNLKNLDLTGCVNISDVCMRELGMNCKSLLSLVISSCHSVIGEGLIAVGDCCKQLRKLSVSRCKNLEK
jgi:hypothetical protein